MVNMSTSDPVVRELYALAWRHAIKNLATAPIVRQGPTNEVEYLEFLSTLADFADGIETNLVATMREAVHLYQISHASIGRACGISRQAVRQRLAREEAATEERRKEIAEWHNGDQVLRSPG